MWGVIALTVATFTVLLAVRRVLVVGSDWVFSRYVAVGGLVAYSTDHDGSTFHVRFEVGGPGVFHNVTVQLFGVPESGSVAGPQPPRHGTPWPPVTVRSTGPSSFPVKRQRRHG